MADTRENLDARNPHGWTLDTLYTHLKGLMEEKDKRDEQRFRGIDKAADTASVMAETLRAAGNEFRQSMNDIIGGCIRREEYNTAHQQLIATVDKLDGVVGGIIAREAGKSEGSKDTNSMRVWLIGLTVAVLGLLGAIVTKH